jgi:hypothetical protein
MQSLGVGLTFEKKVDSPTVSGRNCTNNVTLLGQKIVDSTHHHDCDMSRDGMWQKMILSKKIGGVLETQRIHGSVYFCIDLP